MVAKKVKIKTSGISKSPILDQLSDALLTKDALHGQTFLKSIDVDNIEIDPEQPRVDKPSKELIEKIRDGELELSALDENVREEIEEIIRLAQSIKKHGQLQSILVTPSVNGIHRLTNGERRWLAHIYLSLKSINATIKPDQGVLDKLTKQIADNIHRKDLTLRDTVSMCRRLKELHLLEHGREITAKDFEEILDIKKTTSYKYLAVSEESKQLDMLLIKVKYSL